MFKNQGFWFLFITHYILAKFIFVVIYYQEKLYVACLLLYLTSGTNLNFFIAKVWQL